MTRDIDVVSSDRRISSTDYKIEVRTCNYDNHVNIYFKMLLNGGTAMMGTEWVCITPEAARKLATELLARLDGVDEKSKDKDFFLAVLDGKTKEPRPAPKPKTYKTLAQAKAVALKMAELHKGDTFAIYEKVGQAILPVSPIRFETV